MEKERDDAIADRDEMVDFAAGVGKECFQNSIEQIRFLNPSLEFSTDGMDVCLIVEYGLLMDPSTLNGEAQVRLGNGEGV